MPFTTLIARGLRYHWRTNLALCLGFAAVVATLAGALLVGDSVRGSLAGLVQRRLGNTNYVVSSALFFNQRLAGELGGTPAIVTDGSVTGIKVQVYGLPSVSEPSVSGALIRRLNAKLGDTLLVRVERPSAIPKESLHGRKEDAGRGIRLRIAEASTEFSLRMEQGPVYAVYLPLTRLQRELATPNSVNTVLSEASPPLKQKVTLDELGVRVRTLSDNRGVSVETSGAVISDQLQESVAALAPSAHPIFSYLANSMKIGDRSTPYSLVTAVDAGSISIPPDGIVLNDWTASDLNAKAGDALTLEYYFWGSGGTLETRKMSFRVVAIMPMKGLGADRDLTPEYPGITQATSLHAWDPPFPMNLGLIRPKDEDYWNRYRTTPKAFIAYETGRKLWGSRFGNATSIRIDSPPPNFEAGLRDRVDPAQLGMIVSDLRKSGHEASRGSTDFGEYFAYFSAFVLISALILAGLLFRLGIEQRMQEIGMLRAIGWPQQQIAKLFLAEGAIVAIAGCIVGAVAAVAYCALVLFGLRTWWQGAVGTTELRLFIGPLSLLEGAVAGFVMGLGAMWWALRSMRRISPRALLSGLPPAQARRGKRKRIRVVATVMLVLALLLLGSGSVRGIDATASFFGGAAVLLAAALLWTSALIGSSQHRLLALDRGHSVWKLGARGTAFRPGRALAGIALIASATFLIVGLDAFRHPVLPSSDPHSGTGGFAIAGESELPIYYDPNSPAGRENLNLTGIANVRFFPFRLRPGEDASCLNLYQPRNPRVLGASEAFRRAGRFHFSETIGGSAEERENPWLLLNRDPGKGPIPAIADANSITYILHSKVGGEFVLDPDSDHPVRLQLVAALEGSMLQSELIIAERDFLKVFPHQQGYRFFLIEGPPNARSALNDALSDYGFSAMDTTERLAAYRQVENTYLSTFQALGAVGLLLGTIGLAALLLRNVLERRRELALLRALGYQPSDIRWIVVAENLFISATGLAIGVVCAVVAVLPTVMARGGQPPLMAILALIIAVPATALLSSLFAVRAVTQAPLLAALRSE